MRTMNEHELRTFLCEGSRSAVLSTIRRDGSPHSVPLWYILDGDAVAVMSPGHTAKSGHLQRDPRAALTVHEDRPPYSFVTVEGAVTLSPDVSERRRIGRALAERYLGTDDQIAINGFVEYVSQPGGLLVRLALDRVVGVANVAEQ